MVRLHSPLPFFHQRALWEFSSAGRASALQAEGHRFEPYNSHHLREWLSGRALPCQGKGREFESRLPLQTKEKQKSVSLFCFIAYKLLTSVVFFDNIIKSLVPWPSGKAKVCKTFIPRFKSGWYLQFPPCVDFFITKKLQAMLRAFLLRIIP